MPRPTYTERMRWFHEARFGMFIHWGLYSLLGRGEWVMFHERIPAREYARLARRFTAKKFDADAWARHGRRGRDEVRGAHHPPPRRLLPVRQRGLRLHLGEDRRRSATSWPSTSSACRKAGLKVGLYYSLLDWRFPGYFEPAKLPESSQAMVEQAHAQVRELMTNYGKIDLLWYDGGYVYNGMTQPRRHGPLLASGEINAMARRLQPHIIINNRIGPRRGHRHARAARERFARPGARGNPA